MIYKTSSKIIFILTIVCWYQENFITLYEKLLNEKQRWGKDQNPWKNLLKKLVYV